MPKYSVNHDTIILVIRYSYIIFLLTYCIVTPASWFDNITPVENAKYNIVTLQKAFIKLTANNADPIIGNITSEKVWHEWEDPEPLNNEDYIKLAKFYQFNQPNTLLSHEFKKSTSIDNPRNNLDYLSQLFVNKRIKSNFTQTFFNVITMGNPNSTPQLTAFDKLDIAARAAENEKNGDKLKYAIRKLRGELEKLYFTDLLKYALTQINIDNAKNTIINIRGKDLKKNIKQYLQLVDSDKHQTGVEYKFFNNTQILLAVFDALQKSAFQNGGILKDLTQIENYAEIADQKNRINEIFEILDNFNKNNPIIKQYFFNKNRQEKNFIAAHLLPQTNMLCTRNINKLASLINILISTRKEKSMSYYNLQNTKRDGWSEGVWLSSNTTKSLYSKKLPFTVENDFASKFFLIGTDNKFKSSFILSICYGFCLSEISKNIKSKNLVNNLTINSHFISLYTGFVFRDIFLSGSLNYIINKNTHHRNDTRNNIYDYENECHNIVASSEVGINFHLANNIFIKPAVVFQAYLHTEHTYYEFSHNSINKILPFSITAKNYLNLNTGLKVLCSKQGKVKNFTVISRLWARCLFDISPNSPEFDIGINYNKFNFHDEYNNKFTYDGGLQVSFTKNNITFDIDLCAKNEDIKLIKFISVVFNYHF